MYLDKWMREDKEKQKYELSRKVREGKKKVARESWTKNSTNIEEKRNEVRMKHRITDE